MEPQVQFEGTTVQKQVTVMETRAACAGLKKWEEGNENKLAQDFCAKR
jgi:hypothetical protein